MLVVAPRFDGASHHDTAVIRAPAITHIQDSDFSVPLPSNHLASEIREFQPDIVHSHHPFLLGDAPLRMAAHRNVRRPLAAVVISDLLTSKLLTDIVLPSLYRFFAESRVKRYFSGSGALCGPGHP